MPFISHRGNLNGPEPDKENTPEHIDHALSKVDMCEVDLWKINGVLYLSHDYPSDEHKIDEMFLSERKTRLIIHCKNIDALVHCQSKLGEYHYFWHQEDDYTLTSWGWIWAYPGKDVPPNAMSVAVMPETKPFENIKNFKSICSDYIL